MARPSASVAGSLAAPRSPMTNARSGPWAICAPTSRTFGVAPDGVEVLGERRPLPRDALGHGRAGDVLDALHQLDEPRVAVGGGGREPDAAVAHHHGGDAVPGARRHPRVPRDLGVVVGVDVDPARGDEPAVGIDDPMGGRRGGLAGRHDLDDPAVVHDHVGSARRARRFRPPAGRCAPRDRSSGPVQQIDWRRAAAAREAQRRDVARDPRRLRVGGGRDQRRRRALGARRPLVRARCARPGCGGPRWWPSSRSSWRSASGWRSSR